MPASPTSTKAGTSRSASATEGNLLSVWVCSAKSPWLVTLTTTINRTFLRINSDGRPDSPKARRHKKKGDRGTDHRDQNNGSQRRERDRPRHHDRHLSGNSEGFLGRGPISPKLAVFTPH